MRDDEQMPPVDPQSRGAPTKAFVARKVARERLRLIDLFVWTTVVAICLAAVRWLEPLAAYNLSTVMELWLAITLGTALCSWPWYFSRLRRGPRFRLLAGERLWLLLAIVMPCRLMFEARVLDWLVLLEWCGFACLTVFAAIAPQPFRWRITFGLLGVSWVIGLVGLITGSVWLPDWLIEGQAMAWSGPFVAIPLAGDLISRTRGELRWSHWVGSLAFLSWLGGWCVLYERAAAIHIRYYGG